MHFSCKIKKYCEGMNVYEHLLEDEKAIHIPFALSFTVTITTINGQLKAFLMDLVNKECQEIPDIDFGHVTDIRNIMSPKLKHDMAALDDMTVRGHLEALFGEHLDKKPSEIYDFIYGNTLLMTDLLKKAYKELKHADSALFGKYVSRRISEGNWDDVKEAYLEWVQDQSDFCLELLLEKQEQVLNKYLKAGIMRFEKAPSNQKMKKVDYNYHTELLDCDFEDTVEYKKSYTQFMGFATRRNGMLIIDYNKYGHYIFKNYKKFSESQKVAVFELCVILSLIHQDMARLAAAASKEERIRRCIALLMEERYKGEPLFNQRNHWQAVYRILVDKGYCTDSDFDGFDVFIKRVMPEEVNKPYSKPSVKQISQTDFCKPFEEWAFDPATSKTRRPFDRMVAVAQRFLEILEENGL